MNPIENIITQLKQRRDALDLAIAALTPVGNSNGNLVKKTRVKSTEAKAPAKNRQKRHMSEEGRKRTSDAARRRWAAVKAARGKE